jgi:hypothetical protein
MLIFDLVILFGAGLVQDALNTVYVRSVAEKARGRATILSGLLTVLSFIVFARIYAQVSQIESAGGNVLAYALGNSAGTWLGMRRGA